MNRERIIRWILDNGRIIRKVSLVIVIVAAGIFCAICWWGVALWEVEKDGHSVRPMIIPAIGFTGTYVWFLLVELWGALTGYKKTLSTRYKHFLQQKPEWAVIGIVGLTAFLIAMVSLYVHLAVFW
jgi:magnesium-transporting ATPase (P-type)